MKTHQTQNLNFQKIERSRTLIKIWYLQRNFILKATSIILVSRPDRLQALERILLVRG